MARVAKIKRSWRRPRHNPAHSPPLLGTINPCSCRVLCPHCQTMAFVLSTSYIRESDIDERPGNAL
jgi:hypothetical protein